MAGLREMVTDGTARASVPGPGWSGVLDRALAEIVLYGAGSLQMRRRLRALLDTLAASAPPHRARALDPYRTLLDRTAHDLPDPVMTATATTPDSQGLGGPAPAGEPRHGGLPPRAT
ncbi:hypothetical protein [Streptomyces sp. NPDC088910]|uniref:hypothetical protein n=1 Tax=Streptomyces sp. NPDC088910 TaxID=3365911 RepID=UPI0037F5AA25